MSLITAERLDQFYKGMQSKSLFSVDFIGAEEGDIYTISSEDGSEEYVGELEESLEVMQTVRSLNTTYTVSVLHGSIDYYTTVDVGQYYGIYEVTINTSVLSSIEVRTNPIKTIYRVGESFNSSGLEITANYVNSTALDVTEDCVLSIKDGQALTLSDTTLTISYTESGVTKETTVALTITDSSEVELIQTLAAGSTTVTFYSTLIQSNKKLDLYTNVEGLDYISMDTSTANTVVVTYPQQSSAVSVKLVIH